MLFYIFLVFVSSYSNVCSLISSMSGINIRYDVTSYATCIVVPASSRLVSLKDVSVSVCLQHCAVIQNCVGLNYRRKFKLCDLFSGNGILETSIDCIHISRNDIVLQNSSCVEVCDGQQICDYDGRCSEKVNPGCNYPEVSNGHPLGNMMGVGETQAIECESGFIRRGSRTIECMENGTWDTIPECLKECNISVFHNADIEMNTISSGVDALVRCHEKYVSNRTTSNVDVITEETVACDSDGNWIPNIDCIYIDNLFNIALKKTATQSSTYNDLVAERATDGTWNSGTFPRRFCAQTIPSKAMAWLEIDLQQTYSIRRVKILYGIYEFFWSSSAQVTVTIGNLSNPANICGINDGTAYLAEEVEYICTPALTGRFVRLNKPNNDALNSLRVCEVGVYEI